MRVASYWRVAVLKPVHASVVNGAPFNVPSIRSSMKRPSSSGEIVDVPVLDAPGRPGCSQNVTSTSQTPHMAARRACSTSVGGAAPTETTAATTIGAIAATLDERGVDTAPIVQAFGRTRAPPAPHEDERPRRIRCAMIAPMSNDDVYAGGLLTRALDPATQPPAIQAFMQAEIDLLADFVRADASLLDVGCGSGRHLALLADRVRSGVGLDYQRDYLVLARRRIADPRVQFVVADAARMPFGAAFDAAICVT